MKRDAPHQRDDPTLELLEFIGNAENRRMLVELSQGRSSCGWPVDPDANGAVSASRRLVETLLRLGLARRRDHGSIELTDRVRVIRSGSSVQIVLTAEDGSSVDVTYPVIDE